jgi:hypothetical protein
MDQRAWQAMSILKGPRKPPLLMQSRIRRHRIEPTMAFTRKLLAAAISTDTMKAIIAGADELSTWNDADRAACKSEVDAQVEVTLDAIKVQEKQDFIDASITMFEKSLTTVSSEDRPVTACKWRRLLMKRAGEAKLITAYICAEVKHGSDAAKRCEGFRKVAGMRTAWSTVEQDLAELIGKSNLGGLVKCETNDKGKLAKAKATNAYAMALENLRNAIATRRVVVKQAGEISDLKAAAEAKKAA